MIGAKNTMGKLLGATALLSLAFAPSASAQGSASCEATVADYNYTLGTQAIGSPYQFTRESSLVEQAREIQGFGSNLLKLSLAEGAAARYGTADAASGAYTTLAYVKASAPIQQALDMDFHYYQAWVHSFTGAKWQDGVNAKEARAYYDEMYQLAEWLLSRYSGTGKVFMLGNWEGDWLLAGGAGRKATPSMEAVGGMIDWLNIRQKAIDDAKARVPHEGVELYHYVELNLALKGMEGKRSIAESVLPKTNIDLVSYSSYEAIKRSPKPDLDSIRQPLAQIVQYVEGQLKPKPGLPFERRIFIGEYGYHADKTKPLTVKQQFIKSRYVMQVALELDLPFALIWQFYNNEYAPNGTSKEMSMIDEAGEKRALYYLHKSYFQAMRSYVADTCSQTGAAPDRAAFRSRALKVLEGISFADMQTLAEQGIPAANAPS